MAAPAGAGAGGGRAGGPSGGRWEIWRPWRTWRGSRGGASGEAAAWHSRRGGAGAQGDNAGVAARRGRSGPARQPRGGSVMAGDAAVGGGAHDAGRRERETRSRSKRSERGRSHQEVRWRRWRGGRATERGERRGSARDCPRHWGRRGDRKKLSVGGEDEGKPIYILIFSFLRNNRERYLFPRGFKQPTKRKIFSP